MNGASTRLIGVLLSVLGLIFLAVGFSDMHPNAGAIGFGIGAIVLGLLVFAVGRIIADISGSDKK